MPIDLSRFKVIHGDKVLNALALMNIQMPDSVDMRDRQTILKPEFLDVLVINEDGNIVSICDEAWRFQFLPIVTS